MAVSGLLLLAIETKGQTYIWTGNGNGTAWSTKGNWSGNSAPTNSTSSTVTFAGTKKLTPTLTANLQIGSLVFDASAGAFTLGGTSQLSINNGVTNNSTNTQTLTLPVVLTAAQTWTAASGDLVLSGTLNLGYYNFTVSGANDTTLSGVVSGGSSGNTFTKSGSGTLTLSGSNTFGHVFVVAAGDVILTNSSALGSSTYGNSIAAGAALHLQNNITVNEGSFTVAGDGSGSGAIVNDSGTNAFNTQLTLGGDTTIGSTAGSLTLGGSIATGSSTLTATGAGALIFGGQISGSGNLVTSGSGAKTFNGAIYSTGAVTLGGSGTTTFNSALGNSSALTITNSGTTTFNGSVNINGSISVTGSGNTSFTQGATAGNGGALTLTGSGDTSFGGAVSANNTVTLGGTGSITFSSSLSSNNHAINITDSNAAATVTVGGDLNAGTGAVTVSGAAATAFNGSQISAGSLTVSGSGSVTAAGNVNLSGGSLTVNGSGSTTFTGAQVNVGSITLAGGGDTSFASQINATSLTQSGTGTTTLGGTGNNNISSVTVSGGTLLLDKDSGYAASGTITVTSGELAFGGDNQTSSWTNLTLGTGSVLTLDDTTQVFGTITITGDTVIDFADGGSVLNIQSLVFLNNATLTIINWNSAVDYFSAQVDPGTGTSSISFNGVSGAVWNLDSNGSLTPATPVPEPATYGAWLLGAGLALAGLRRWRQRRRAGGTAAPLNCSNRCPWFPAVRSSR